MKKQLKQLFILTIFAFALCIGLIIWPGKNKTQYIASFETKAIAYRSFRNISYFPKLLSLSLFIKEYPKGLWQLPEKCSFINLLKCLKHNKRIDQNCKITFVEGMRADEIEKILNNEPNLSSDCIKIEEGTLFPETYCFKAGTKRSVIFKMAHDLMQKKLDDVFFKLTIQALNNNIKLPINKKELLILASIVQKEANKYEDMLKVAACFFIRLEKKMRLESCASAIYGMIKKGLPIFFKNGSIFLRYKDIKIKTPYNTYILDKLPIGPICTPGHDAINAVAKVLDNAIKNAVITKKGKKLKYPKSPIYFYSCNGTLSYANDLLTHNKHKFRCALNKNKTLVINNKLNKYKN